MTVVSGLASADRPSSLGDGNGDHTRSDRVVADRRALKRTEGADLERGTSADQVAAAVLGKDTPLPSLELAIDLERPVGRLRQRLQLRLREHDVVAHADDAAADARTTRGSSSSGCSATAARPSSASALRAREPQHPRLRRRQEFDAAAREARAGGPRAR